MLSPILACVDVDKAIAYYVDVLGFDLAWNMPPDENGHSQFACVKLADCEILLGITEGFITADDINKRGIGIQLYINLPQSIAIEPFYEAIQKQNGQITKSLETRDWGEKAFNVRDVDGYHLMFAQSPQT